MRLSTKIILIFSVFLLLGGGLIGYVVYQSRLAKGVEVQLSVPEKVLIGVPFDLKLNVSNSSQNPLQDVRLSVSLPDGLAFLGSPAAKNIDYKELDGIAAGGLVQENFRLIALNGANTFKRISSEVSYSPGSVKSRFQKTADVDLAVGGYAITLDIATPQKVFSGENFVTEISYKNASDTDFDNLNLKIDYPPTFNFVKSTLEPDIDKNSWVLGGLRSGSENSFKVTGSLIGPERATFDLKTTLEATFLGQHYPININTATVAIATSPLSLKISLNGDTGYVAHPGDSLNYNLTYINNTDVGLRDVIIKAQLVGAMYDLSTLQSNATFRSRDSTLIWNAANTPELGTVSPGQSGSVNFTLRARTNYPIRRLSDKNFTLKIAATIESPTVPHFVAAEKTFSLANLETKVAGSTSINTKIYFRDANSGIVNKGPFPPRVNQPTDYTVHWVMTNYGTDVKDAEVRAFLGGNVRFTGVVKSNTDSSPVYNDRTQEVVWNVSRVPATAGIVGRAIEAIFQIEATPSSLDAGKFMELIKETALKAVDEFTDQELTSRNFSVTTQLPDDPTVTSGQGIVTQ